MSLVEQYLVKTQVAQKGLKYELSLFLLVRVDVMRDALRLFLPHVYLYKYARMQGLRAFNPFLHTVRCACKLCHTRYCHNKVQKYKHCVFDFIFSFPKIPFATASSVFSFFFLRKKVETVCERCSNPRGVKRTRLTL